METAVIGKLYPRTNPAEFKYKVIDKWVPQSEVWAFRYGSEATTGLAALSSINIMYCIRKQLKHRHYARLSSYLPVVGMSMIGAKLIQYHVDDKIISLSSCSSCTVAKGALGQLIFGTIYPVIMAQIVGFYIADRMLSYPVPSLVQAPRELFQLGAKLINANAKTILSLAAIQVLTAIFVTHMKQKTFYKIFSSN